MSAVSYEFSDKEFELLVTALVYLARACCDKHKPEVESLWARLLLTRRLREDEK